LGLSRFLRNEKTVPPLTIAVNGEWGTGKSSLMNLLRQDLVNYGFRPVWFNAWHHQKEEHLLAALLQNVRLQGVPQFWKPGGAMFRARLLRYRISRYRVPVLLFAAIAAVLVGYDLHRSQASPVPPINWGDIELGKLWEVLATAAGKAPTRSWFTSLFSLLGMLVGLWKGLSAFGVNPASLLTSLSGGSKLRDLDAQTSFRQRLPWSSRKSPAPWARAA